MFITQSFSFLFFILCIVFLFSYSNCTSPSKSSFLGFTSDQNSSNEYPGFSDQNELIQLITITRHGAGTPILEFYSDEWLPYGIKDLSSSYELLTPLGEAQCWSNGRNLALENGEDFFESSDQTTDFSFQYIYEQKSSDCAIMFWLGVKNIVPTMAQFNLSYVIETFNEKGTCPGCLEEAKFPFLESQNISTSTKISLSDMQLNFAEEIDTTILNFEDECDNIKEYFRFGDEIVDLPNLHDRKLLLISRSPNMKQSSYAYQLMAASHHFYHNLPNFGLSHELEKGLQKDSNWMDSKSNMEPILNVDDNCWRVAAVYGRLLMKEIKENILNGKRWIGYLAHNNNLFAFMTYFYQAKVINHDIYYPAFASSIEIKIYRVKRNGKYFVNIAKDHKTIDIADCGKRCHLEKFKKLIEKYIDLGGDLGEYCEIKK